MSENLVYDMYLGYYCLLMFGTTLKLVMCKFLVVAGFVLFYDHLLVVVLSPSWLSLMVVRF